jgi:hypothetical protein
VKVTVPLVSAVSKVVVGLVVVKVVVLDVEVFVPVPLVVVTTNAPDSVVE